MNLPEEQKKAVLDLVEQRWRDQHKGTLLSEIGIALSKSGVRKSRRHGGVSLRTLLETELANLVRIVEHPTDPALHAVLPSSVPVGTDKASLFAPTRAHNPAASTARFRPAVWAAFIKPISSGFQRYLQLEPVLRFDDLPAGAPRPAGSYVVPSDKIGLLEGATPHGHRVEDEIRAWAESERIPVDLLLQRGESTGLPVGDTVLHLLLETLPAKDHHRLAIPLDLVGALLTRRVR